ncbi:unnamed protein product [Notodromas monacha]|uniref:PH domain-containing protein n=1 Tax=Notodromas monacha TaxID=399045 RepID=A0A7R9BG81_9CRUS|nr:unnamed protein product [Notodromas monacha]CAG0914893.1 unnamed protein product [Notodromas monacha]
MDLFRRAISSTMSSAQSAAPQGPLFRGDFRVTVREVNRCGWVSSLRFVEDHERGFGFSSSFGKTTPEVFVGEKRWAVFCVHDDEIPFVELYENDKKAASHKPNAYFNLQSCLHVSPCIIPLGDGELRYPFVITLAESVLQFAAPDRPTMMEWVDCLRNKLRDLKILQPKFNIYSMEPIPKALLPANRNPLSPLPPFPNTGTIVPPGLEIVRGSERRSFRAPALVHLTQEPSQIIGLSGGASERSATFSPAQPPAEEDTLEHYLPVWGLGTPGGIPVSSAVDEETLVDVSPISRVFHAWHASASTDEAPLPRALETETSVAANSSLNRIQLNNSLSTTEVPPLPARPPPPRPPNRVQNHIMRTLKEEQVSEFQRQQDARVLRVRLPRRDAHGSIALVDCFNSVWFAGWKQKEHPMLHHYFHIGDQLKTVNGTQVISAAQAQKLLKDSSNNVDVEILFRRVPSGKICLIKRSVVGESLGLIREGNTNIIKEVQEDGLAARSGLPLKAKTSDGLSFTEWVLTEVNGRPLNLFFKGNEVEERLNAVGQEISLLVQPRDLVTTIKRNLKLIRNHKEYIVQ